ncbi:MAG: AmmeMemoRadiSam system protein A [Betaproteobacteria bacterium HGW-Betaproteobacteria-11]|nr:MAG: AmmeMemoRadiSam system protein A [Betaproteobacteria bacterium HGW-Betaproteobacteria-11]
MSAEKGRLLTALARAAIAAELTAGRGQPLPALPHPAWLDTSGACFITLTENGQLRGCIGSLEAHRSLHDDVIHNARAAAFADPRFPPLEARELPRVHIEVSLLGTPRALHFTDEADALRRLRPGSDGVIFECGSRRATFLPQVWEQLSDPRQFLAQLKRKAGFPADFWAQDVRLFTYPVEKFEEDEHHDS